MGPSACQKQEASNDYPSRDRTGRMLGPHGPKLKSNKYFNNIKLWYTNADILTAHKLNELQAHVKLEHPDIICITEVEPKNSCDKICDEAFSINGYNMIRLASNRGIMIYSETPHEQPPLLWGHIYRHHYIFLTSHLNVNPWWTATPLTWSEASDFGSSHPWRAATQQLLEVASHGIHGWFGCGLTDIHVNHTSGQPWVHRPKACKGVDHT